jgi:putative aldouronate transport system substrate-binding protein
LSGEYYDLVYAPDWAPYRADALNGGGWQPWEPYIDLIPEYYEMIEPYRELLLEIGPDNESHVYRLPTVKEFSSFPVEMRFNKTVADKLGITQALYDVKNVYELDPYLKMYKDAYPVGMAVLAVASGALQSVFQMEGNPFFASYCDKTGRYETGVFTDWFADYIKLRRDWYAKGYIPDYELTDSPEDLMVKFGPESFLVTFKGGKPGGEDELNLDNKERYGFDWGCTALTPAVMQKGDMLTNSWALNARSRNPEAAAFIYQLICTTPELNTLLNFGIEGEHYNMEDGILVKVENPRYYPGIPYLLGNRLICPKLPGEPDNLAEIYEEFNQKAIRLPTDGFQWPPESAWEGINSDMFWGVYSAIGTQYSRSIECGTITDREIEDIKTKLRAGNYKAMEDVMNREFEKFKESRKEASTVSDDVFEQSL